MHTANRWLSSFCPIMVSAYSINFLNGGFRGHRPARESPAADFVQNLQHKLILILSKDSRYWLRSLLPDFLIYELYAWIMSINM